VTVVSIFEIENEVFHLRGSLMPFLTRLDVDGSNHIRTAGEQAVDKMSADESASSANDRSLTLKLHLSQSPFL
jgi:hypothetical protein